jgi:predicted ATPase
MKLKQIKICNYRSFGEDACLNFNSNVMALIGLNGIGKSNALEAISRMKFFENGCESVIPSNAINQNTQRMPHLHLEVEFSKEERCALEEKFGCAITATHVEYIFEAKNGRTKLRFDGAFTEAIENNSTLAGIQKDLQAILETTKKNASYHGHWEYEAFADAVTGYTHCYVPRLKEALSWMQNNVINPSFPEPRRGTAIHVLEKLLSNLETSYAKFRMFSPHIFLFRDVAEFPREYDSDAIASWDRHLDDNHKIALSRFLGAIGSSRDELVAAFQENNLSRRQSIRDKIQRSARKLLEEFNCSFMQNQAGIDLSINFDGKTLRFTVFDKNIAGSVLWPEASAGVRWYLNAFFELRRALKSPNAIILIDEPAIHLHVNAQKEVLGLLYQMASEGKYLIYTTHSPFMIDSNRLGDIRAIVRMGETSTIRPLTTMQVPNCQLDVLAPICHAIGYELGANLSPCPDKINLITEGLSDACYIGAMARVLISDDSRHPFILPSQGAPKIHNLVSIMLGWGLKYKVVLDNDGEGQKQRATMAENFGEEVDAHVVYVSEQDGFVTENLISKEDYVKACGTDYNPDMPKQAKIAKARQFAGMVDSGELVPDAETRKNFTDLFERLGLMGNSSPVSPSAITAQGNAV